MSEKTLLENPPLTTGGVDNKMKKDDVVSSKTQPQKKNHVQGERTSGQQCGGPPEDAGKNTGAANSSGEASGEKNEKPVEKSNEKQDDEDHRDFIQSFTCACLMAQ